VTRGIIASHGATLRRLAAAVRASAPPAPRAYVISYPKSGRTWLSLMLGRALSAHYCVRARSPLDTLALTGAAGLLPTKFEHDGTDLRAALHYASLPADKRAYRDKKVIFLTRDTRDILVSSFFETTRRRLVFENRPPPFDGTMSDFVRSPVLGARKVASFYEIWARSRHEPRDFLLVSYEQLHAAPGELLTDVLRFIGAYDVNPGLVAEAVAYGSFENMRSLERADALGDPRLRPGDPADPDSYKVRRGVADGYVDYLSGSDLAYIDQELALRGYPFASGARLLEGPRRSPRA